MKAKNIADHTALTADQLVTLGHFISGFSADDIKTIAPEAFK